MTTTPEPAGFSGAKAAFFCGSRVLCYLRDDTPGLRWPGRWDLPGGGREGDETAEACLLRELHEEFGLILPPARLELRLDVTAMDAPGQHAVFFAGRLTPGDLAAIRFGDEGQRWEAMEVQAFLSHPQGIPPLQDRVRRVMGAFLPG